VHSYPAFLPVWDRSLHHEPYVLLENVSQPGAKADPAKPHLLGPNTNINHLTPKFGSVVEGVQLSSLDETGKNELALLVAERGVVAFRDQDFVDQGPKAAVEYGKYFGELHIHPVTGHPQGFPELHIVYRGPEARYISNLHHLNVQESLRTKGNSGT
jgi:sulfonate dioxygenase